MLKKNEIKKDRRSKRKKKRNMVVSPLSNRNNKKRTVLSLPIVNVPFPSKRLTKVENAIGNMLLLIWILFPLLFFIGISIWMIPVLVALFG